MLRASIQKPQSGWTYAIRSGPPSNCAAASIRRATSSGDSATVSLMSITPIPKRAFRSSFNGSSCSSPGRAVSSTQWSARSRSKKGRSAAISPRWIF